MLIARIVTTTTIVRLVASSRVGQLTLRNSATVSRKNCEILFSLRNSFVTVTPSKIAANHYIKQRAQPNLSRTQVLDWAISAQPNLGPLEVISFRDATYDASPTGNTFSTQFERCRSFCFSQLCNFCFYTRCIRVSQSSDFPSLPSSILPMGGDLRAPSRSFTHFCDHARPYCSSAFANRKPLAFVQRHWRNKLYLHGHVIARHHHLHALGQLHIARHV
jgi:hypothetical protein